MNSTDTGAFGFEILALYCGDTITNQFYDKSHPMLLTEREMAFITTQLMIEFTISIFITIIFQTTFRIYIRSISSCCWKWERRNKSHSHDTPDHKVISLTIRTHETVNIPLEKWSNDDIISWIKTASIPNEIQKALIKEITQLECTGSDIASLMKHTNGNPFPILFESISNNTDLCDKLFTELKNLKPTELTETPTSPKQSNHNENDTDNTSSNGSLIKMLTIICIIWSYLLALIVMVHYFHQLHLYFKFVRNTVQFDSTDAQTLEECDIQGIGEIACPGLFESFEGDEKKFINEPYTSQTAENVCFWIYSVLVIANPTLFQYLWFASFVAFDYILYLTLMFLFGCCVITSCNCWGMFVCCCGCCCYKCDCPCCPVPRCCCHITWCNGTGCGCCCYMCYGCFGFIWWLLLWGLSIVIMAWVLLIFEIPFVIIVIILSVLAFVIVSVVTLPLCLCNPKIFCCLVFETYIGNKDTVDLKVNTINRDEDSLCLWSMLKCLCRGFISEDELSEKILCDPIQMRAVGHDTIMFYNVIWIMIIVGVQTLISTFILYFVVDGTIFISWHYFEPFFNGVKDALMSFVDVVMDLEELKYILMESISLDSFIDFNPNQSDGFKYALLLHRTILHSLIGIIYVLINP